MGETVAVGDPMAMQSSMMAMIPQARAWIAATYDALAAAGLGFPPDLLDAIAASAAAHPYPEGYEPGQQPTAADIAAAQELAQRSLSADYPPNGFDPADPRLAPVEGVTLALNAIAARAIGWNTDDEYVGRIVAAVGFEREVWERAILVLRERIQADAALAAFYGQLYAAA